MCFATNGVEQFNRWTPGSVRSGLNNEQEMQDWRQVENKAPFPHFKTPIFFFVQISFINTEKIFKIKYWSKSYFEAPLFRQKYIKQTKSISQCKLFSRSVISQLPHIV